MTTPRLTVSQLSASECWTRLETIDVGRVGITVGALPVILPVFYCVVDASIVFRATEGTKLSAATNNTVIAFEAGDYQTTIDQGWSVIAQGIGRVVTDPEELAVLGLLPLRLVANGDIDADRFVVITPTRISGRMIEPVGTSRS